MKVDLVYLRLQQMVEDFQILVEFNATDEERAIAGRFLYEQVEGFMKQVRDNQLREELDRSIREAELARELNRGKR